MSNLWNPLSYKKRRLKSKLHLQTKASTMKRLGSTWPRPRTVTSESKSICLGRNWPPVRASAVDMRNQLKNQEERLSFKIKNIRLLLKLPKRPKTISLLCRPRQKMNARNLMTKSRNFKLNWRRKKTTLTTTTKELKKEKKQKITIKTLTSQIQLLS